MAIQLSGSLAITGSLVATSQIVAQTLNVQQVTSSIVYSSGSNIFGNSLANTQIMTGSVSITGSLSVNGSPVVLTNQTASTTFVQGGNSFGTQALIGTNDTQNLALETNGTVRMTISSSGNVGVGISSPIVRLQASGTIAVGEDTTGWGRFSFDNTTNTTRLQSSKNGSESVGLSFWTQASGGGFAERMIISGSNVGIGTSTPTAKLEVNGGFIRAQGTDSDQYFLEGVRTGTSTTLRIYDNSSVVFYDSFNTMHFRANQNGGSGGAILFNGGNVGIGTTAPGGKLHVYENGASNWQLYLQTSQTSAKRNSIGFFDNGNTNIASILTDQNNNGGADFAINVPNGSPRLFISGSGNVGIGTITPGSRLESKAPDTGATTNYTSKNIIANSPLVGGYTGAPIVSMLAMYDGTIHGADIGYLYDATGYGLVFSVNNDTVGNPIEALRINRSGNVGIGTTSPAEQLTISGTGSRGLGIVTITSGDPYIRLYDNTTIKGDIWWGRSGNYMGINSLSGGSSVNTAINAFGGNVGIGTTSPSYKLDVGGTGRFSTELRITDVPASAYAIKTVSADWANGSTIFTGIKIGAAGDTFLAGVDLRAISNYASTSGTQFAIAVNSVGNTMTEVLRINAAGNVGIGTTNPSSKLEVAGEISSTYSTDSRIRILPDFAQNYIQSFNFAADTYKKLVLAASGISLRAINGSSSLEILSSGNVGIGTTSPSQLVEAYQSANADVVYQVTNPNTGGAATAQFFASNGTNRTQFYHTGTSYNTSGAIVASQGGMFNQTTAGLAMVAQNASGIIRFATGGTTERVRIDASGNVGIGTTSPGSSRLRIAGTHVSGDSLLSIQPVSNNVATLGFYNSSAVRKGLVYMDTGFLALETDTGIPIYFNPSGNTRAVIDSNGNVGIGTTSPTARLFVSGSSNVVNVQGSGSATSPTLMAVDGGNGRLFEVTDDLSDSLFSVNTIAGLPVIEAFANNSVNIGTYNAVSGSTLAVTGSNVRVNGTITNIVPYRANTFIQLTSVATKTFSVSGQTGGSFAVTDFSGVPSNAKALLVYGWYHITGYSIGSGQGDHAVSWFGLANDTAVISWSGPGAAWPGSSGTFTPQYYGSFAMDHDGDASVGSSDINYYGTWHNGIINVNANGLIYYTLAFGYSGGTHHNALYCVGYWI